MIYIVFTISIVFHAIMHSGCYEKDNINNKYIFIKGHVDMQTVKKSKKESTELSNEINAIIGKNCLKEYINTLKENNITSKNKIPCYIKLIDINYVLELVKNFIKVMKKNNQNDHTIEILITYISNICSQIFARVVKSGEEIGPNDILYLTRVKTNELFYKTLNLKDCLTGYINSEL